MRWVVIALSLVAVILACWLALIAFARHRGLRPAALVPLLVSTPGALNRLRKDPQVPRRVRVVLGVTLLWVLSPIDLIPEFIPVIGPLDDVVVVALALWFTARHVPHEAVIAAWPEQHRATVTQILSGRD